MLLLQGGDSFWKHTFKVDSSSWNQYCMTYWQTQHRAREVKRKGWVVSGFLSKGTRHLPSSPKRSYFTVSQKSPLTHSAPPLAAAYKHAQFPCQQPGPLASCRQQAKPESSSQAPTLAQSPSRTEMWIQSGSSCGSRLIRITWLGVLGLHSWDDLSCFALRTAWKAENVDQNQRNPTHLPKFPSQVGKWFGNHFGAAFYVCFNCSKTTHVLLFLLNNACNYDDDELAARTEVKCIIKGITTYTTLTICQAYTTWVHVYKEHGKLLLRIYKTRLLGAAMRGWGVCC